MQTNKQAIASNSSSQADLILEEQNKVLFPLGPHCTYLVKLQRFCTDRSYNTYSLCIMLTYFWSGLPVPHTSKKNFFLSFTFLSICHRTEHLIDNDKCLLNGCLGHAQNGQYFPRKNTVTALTEAQSALGIQSGEDLIGIWTGPYTLRAIWPEMGRRAFHREERLWATVRRWGENKRDWGNRKDPMASFLPLSLSSLHLTSPIWLLVLGLISTLLMCLTRKFPCSYKWHRKASLLVFNKKETRSCHCHLPMWPKCGASLLPFTDQLGLQVTTSGHAEPPLRVRPGHVIVWLWGKPRQSQTLTPSGGAILLSSTVSLIPTHLQQCRNHLLECPDISWNFSPYHLRSTKHAALRTILIMLSLCEPPNIPRT